jgi:hypothetical protein
MDRLARFGVREGDLFVVVAVILDGGGRISWAVMLRFLLYDHVFCNIIRMLINVRYKF